MSTAESIIAPSINDKSSTTTALRPFWADNNNKHPRSISEATFLIRRENGENANTVVQQRRQVTCTTLTDNCDVSSRPAFACQLDGRRPLWVAVIDWTRQRLLLTHYISVFVRISDGQVYGVIRRAPLDRLIIGSR